MHPPLTRPQFIDRPGRPSSHRRRCRNGLVAFTVGLAMLAVGPSLLASQQRGVRYLRAWSLGAQLLPDRGVVLQTNSADCGHACLMNVLAHYGRRAPQRLVEEARRARLGLTVGELVGLGRDVGLPARMLRIPRPCLRRALRTVPLPTVALVGTHYLLIERPPVDEVVALVDPAVGRLRAPVTMLERGWRGVLVTFDADSTTESVCGHTTGHLNQGGLS